MALGSYKPGIVCRFILDAEVQAISAKMDVVNQQLPVCPTVDAPMCSFPAMVLEAARSLVRLPVLRCLKCLTALLYSCGCSLSVLQNVDKPFQFYVVSMWMDACTQAGQTRCSLPGLTCACMGSGPRKGRQAAAGHS